MAVVVAVRVCEILKLRHFLKVVISQNEVGMREKSTYVALLIQRSRVVFKGPVKSGYWVSMALTETETG